MSRVESAECGVRSAKSEQGQKTLTERCQQQCGFVLHVRVVTGTGGGPEKTILNSPRFLKSFGYGCACAYLHPPSDPGFATLQQRAAALDAELISVPDRGATDWRVVRRLLQICRERNVTVWHGHDHKSNAIGLLLRRWHPMKLVSTVHGWIVTNRKLAAYRQVDLACLRHYDEVICVSDALLDECLAAQVPLAKCRVIENAIDVSQYATLPSQTDARQTLGLPINAPIVVAIGRLSPEKGFDLLIRAVAQLLESGMDLRLLIAGEGSERATLETLIQQTGRSEQIRLLGHVADPRSLFAAADVFALSSRSEGLPNVLLESLACGVPVVATAVGGVPRVIADDVNGLLIRPDDADGLSLALSRLLHNDALKTSLVEAGRQTLAERYSFDARMRKVVAVYESREATAEPRHCESVAASRLNAINDDATPWADAQGYLPSLFHSSKCTASKSASEGEWSPRLEDNDSVKRSPSLALRVTSQPHGWSEFLAAKGYAGFSQWPEWSQALSRGLGHQTFFVQAQRGAEIVGVLPLQLVESRLFGRFLVSLPYLNTAGVIAESDDVARALIDRAVELADALDVKHLELRHEQPVEHPKLVAGVTDKVHMRLPLPNTADELWDSIKAKVRNQIRKAQKTEGFTVHWGGEDLLPEFYDIFCRNMRDLGTPPFSQRLFAEILATFSSFSDLGLKGRNSIAQGNALGTTLSERSSPEGAQLTDGCVSPFQGFDNFDSANPGRCPGLSSCGPSGQKQSALAELCVVRLQGRAVASGLLVHGPGATQVPSASSLREFNSTNANMLLYWNLLTRAIERGQREFDFGRSSLDSGTFKFKAQWGAVEHPAVWQHYVRRGQAADMRPTNGKFQKAIQVWQKLPVWLTKLIGPTIVRGIP